MGLFGKLKDNMNHGGVKVHIQAPSSVPGNQVIPVTVSVTADSSQTINSIKAEIKASAREEGIGFGGGGMGGGVGVREGRTMSQTVAQVESREPFTIGPGETKTVNLQLFIDGNAGSGNSVAQLGNMGGGIGGAFQALATVAQTMEHVNYIYTVHASADVAGVSIDPSDKLPIQILPPGEAAPAAGPVLSAVDTGAQPPAAPPLPPVPVIPVMPAAPPPPQPPADQNNPNQPQA
jgi:hypothetical protein